jgi:hypothetical protein
MLSFSFHKNFLDVLRQTRDVSAKLHGISGAVEQSLMFEDACYKPEYFKAYEIVDPVTFSKFGEKSFQFMDARILWTADALREYFGKPCIVNNYITARPGVPPYKESGFRLAPVGAALYSQHLYGRALDIKIQDVPAEQARQEIISKHKTEPAFRFITAIEEGVDWLHIDCRNTLQDGLFIFKKAGS